MVLISDCVHACPRVFLFPVNIINNLFFTALKRSVELLCSCLKRCLFERLIFLRVIGIYMNIHII